MSIRGFIALFRSFLEWEFYKNQNVKNLFIHCLLKANYKDKKWEGMVVERGSFITSIPKLSKETGLTCQNVRTALDKLEKSKNLTRKTTNQYTQIFIVNYDTFQDKCGYANMQTNIQLTDEQHSTNIQLTTTNNNNNTTSRLMIDINSLCNRLGFSFLNEKQAELISSYWLDNFSMVDIKEMVEIAKGNNPTNLFAYVNRMVYNKLQSKRVEESKEDVIELIDYKWWEED